MASCNNLKNPILGAAYTPFGRVVPSDYDDGISAPRQSGKNWKGPLPNPRELSVKVSREKRIHKSRLIERTGYETLFVGIDSTQNT